MTGGSTHWFVMERSMVSMPGTGSVRTRAGVSAVIYRRVQPPCSDHEHDGVPARCHAVRVPMHRQVMQRLAQAEPPRTILARGIDELSGVCQGVGIGGRGGAPPSSARGTACHARIVPRRRRMVDGAPGTPGGSPARSARWSARPASWWPRTSPRTVPSPHRHRHPHHLTRRLILQREDVGTAGCHGAQSPSLLTALPSAGQWRRR